GCDTGVVVSAPRSLSKREVASVESRSFRTYAHGFDGWKPAWRGPAPGRLATDGGVAGTSLPLAASSENTNVASRPLSGTTMKRSRGSNTTSCGRELGCSVRCGPGLPGSAGRWATGPSEPSSLIG